MRCVRVCVCVIRRKKSSCSRINIKKRIRIKQIVNIGEIEKLGEEE